MKYMEGNPPLPLSAGTGGCDFNSTLGRRLVRALRDAAPGPLLVDTTLPGPQQAVDRDLNLTDPGPLLFRLWSNQWSIIASCKQARSPRFPSASAQSAAAGWPVVARRSGGTAVVHRPGIWNFSLIRFAAPAEDVAIERDYAMLLSVLRQAMARIGIICDQGDVPGAHCDGKYNLRWQGRKLAGTAACITRRDGQPLRVFHAALAVDGSVREDLVAIQRFEGALGEYRDYACDAHVTVRQILDETNIGGRPHDAHRSTTMAL